MRMRGGNFMSFAFAFAFARAIRSRARVARGVERARVASIVSRVDSANANLGWITAMDVYVYRGRLDGCGFGCDGDYACTNTD